MTALHQVLSGAGPVDAVTRQALAIREHLTAWGFTGTEHAVHIDPRIAGRVRPFGDLRPAPGDLVLLHYSAYAPRLRRLLEWPNRLMLLSHNVTPARWFWDAEPTVAIHCALGRRQLPDFAARAEVVAGVSAFNATELGSDVVVPILFRPSAPRAPRPRGRELLFVGRLTPHKRQDELIRLVALLRSTGEPDLRLRLVGEPLSPGHLRALQGLAERLAPGAVVLESSLSDEELADRYARAAVFVCASEHEGFCIPLLEAFDHGVPVVARPHGAVPETAGDAAVLVPAQDGLGTFAEAVRLVLHDGELASELAARGRRRLDAYAPDAVAARLRSAVQALAAA